MKIDKLPLDPGRRQARKRIGRGRGSGQGTYAGKGLKGQKARSGVSWRSSFEGGQMPVARRIPKRGFNNIFRVEYTVINVGRLGDLFNANDTVDVATLKSRNLAKGKKPLKILGDGEISKPLVVRAHKFSRLAIEKIQSAGGKCEVISDNDSKNS